MNRACGFLQSVSGRRLVHMHVCCCSCNVLFNNSNVSSLLRLLFACFLFVRANLIGLQSHTIAANTLVSPSNVSYFNSMREGMRDSISCFKNQLTWIKTIESTHRIVQMTLQACAHCLCICLLMTFQPSRRVQYFALVAVQYVGLRCSSAT